MIYQLYVMDCRQSYYYDDRMQLRQNLITIGWNVKIKAAGMKWWSRTDGIAETNTFAYLTTKSTVST